MIVRILILLLSFILFVNLCIITIGYIKGENLYQKYGKQILIGFALFIFMVLAFYLAIALIGLN
ncbi:MAG: hypothetical protein IJY61_08200 [Candidatus Gastranaerophilales bacterium]|nr:hypothetical protein [Candidatus Gastranaerophilales bacterium]